MRMKHAQIQALTALLNAIDTAVTEEREFWNDQHQTADHRPPDWLAGLEECFEEAKGEFKARRSGRGWSIPVPVLEIDSPLFRDTLNPNRHCVPIRANDYPPVTVGDAPPFRPEVTCRTDG